MILFSDFVLSDILKACGRDMTKVNNVSGMAHSIGTEHTDPEPDTPEIQLTATMG